MVLAGLLGPLPAACPDIPATDADVAPFLTQATFGATDAAIANPCKVGYSAWLDEMHTSRRSCDGHHGS